MWRGFTTGHIARLSGFCASAEARLLRLAGVREALTEILIGQTQALLKGYLRFPAQNATGLADIRTSLLGIILRQRMEIDWKIGTHQGANALGKFKDGNFVRITNIGWLVLVRLEKLINSREQIRDVTETSRLFAISVDGNRLPAERLIQKIRQSATIV